MLGFVHLRGQNMVESNRQENTSQRFTDELFRQVPVCLWIEDFSDVFAIIENLRVEGVSDFQKFFHENPKVVQKCAAAVKVMDVNQTAVNLHKARDRKQLLNNIHQTFTDVSLQAFTRELLALVGNKKEFSSSTELLTLDGQVLYCLIKAFVDPIFDSWSRVYVAITDISAVKNAEEALRHSEAHFRDLYDRAPSGYQSLDQNGFYLHVNQTMLKILGYPRDELIGHWFGDFLVPEDKLVFEKKFPQFIDLGYVQGVRFRIRHKDNSILDIEFDGRTVVDSDGSFQRTHCVMRDITSQVATEKARDQLARQNELILLAAGDGILGIDDQGKIDFANPAVERLTGWSAAELLGKSEHEILHHTDQAGATIPRDECPILIPVREGHPVTGKNLFWRKDGTSFPIEFNCQPIERNGVVESSVLTFRDTSERENLERQLALSQKLEAVGQLAGGLAHDFNNILQVMMGEAELALDGASTHMECRQSLQSIKKGILKASGLTRQLLAFGRCQVLDKKVENIEDLVDNILRMLRRLVPEDVEISFAPGPVSVPVLMDVGQIEQVLVNLCINARDAMPGGGQLKLETGKAIIDDLFLEAHPWARKGDFALITVSDTGCGMDQETLGQIFEPFFTTKAEDSGTGLGLATAYGIIKQHDGFIHVYSEPNLGTAFRIYLPVTGEGAIQKTEPRISRELKGGSEIILLAEDDSMVREGFCKILKQFGYQVLEAKNGEEALHLIRTSGLNVELAVLDVIMPKVSGPEVFAALRALDNNLPVIFCSGHSRDFLDGDVLRQKDVILLNKPVSTTKLLNKVREMLDSAPS